MTSISNLVNHSKWSDYFVTQPLTLVQFVRTSKVYDWIYPHILQELEEFDKAPVSQLYIQSCVASGKSTLINILIAYKIYLFCITKEPNELWSLSYSVRFAFGILCTRKSSQLVMSSLLGLLEQLPMFNVDQSNLYKPGFININTSKQNALMEAYLVNQNRSVGVPLEVVSISSAADLLGCTFVGAAFTEIAAYLQDTDVESKDVLDLIKKTIHRINARLPNEEFINLAIIDKDPYDVEIDPIDNYIWETVPYIKDARITHFMPVWELRPKNYDLTKTIFFDYSLEKIVKDKSATSLSVPAELESVIKKDAKAFIRDFLGFPTSTIDAPEKRIIKKLHNELLEANVKIIMESGKFYFKDKKTGYKLEIQDLF